MPLTMIRILEHVCNLLVIYGGFDKAADSLKTQLAVLADDLVVVPLGVVPWVRRVQDPRAVQAAKLPLRVIGQRFACSKSTAGSHRPVTDACSQRTRAEDPGLALLVSCGVCRRRRRTPPYRRLSHRRQGRGT